MTAFTPELTAAARAMRDTLIRYRFTEGKHGWDVLDIGCVLHTFKTSTECREWIDCQAFAAGLAALLPVSDAVRSEMSRGNANAGYCDASEAYAAEFTAAINHITGGVK